MTSRIVVVGGAALVLVSALAVWRLDAQTGKSQEELRTPFIGAWRLVSMTGGDEVNIANRGAKPTGIIFYDAHGWMAAQIQPDRQRPTYTGQPNPQQALDRMRGYVAYFGTYTVDEKAHTVTHHRVGMLDANEAEYVRRFEMSPDGNRIKLTPLNRPGPALDLVWERVK
jgi:hypothetical protein